MLLFKSCTGQLLRNTVGRTVSLKKAAEVTEEWVSKKRILRDYDEDELTERVRIGDVEERKKAGTSFYEYRKVRRLTKQTLEKEQKVTVHATSEVDEGQLGRFTRLLGDAEVSHKAIKRNKDLDSFLQVDESEEDSEPKATRKSHGKESVKNHKAGKEPSKNEDGQQKFTFAEDQISNMQSKDDVLDRCEKMSSLLDKVHTGLLGVASDLKGSLYGTPKKLQVLKQLTSQVMDCKNQVTCQVMNKKARLEQVKDCLKTAAKVWKQGAHELVAVRKIMDVEAASTKA